jgi:hypothetical protein
VRALIVKSKTGAESSSKSFIDQIDLSSTGVVCCVTYRTLLDGRSGTRYADDEMTTFVSIARFTDERAQHLLRDVEVENSAGTDGSVYFQTTWLTAQKFDCLVAHANDIAGVTIDCDH